MAKRMKIDRYCRRLNCRPLNVLFNDVQITLTSYGVPLLGAVKQGQDGESRPFF